MQTATKQMNLRMGRGDLLQRMPYEAPDMQIVHVQIEKGFAQSTTAGTVEAVSWEDTDWSE